MKPFRLECLKLKVPPKELNMEKSMGMSFFAACPLTGGLSVPRKSGHTRNADLTSIRHGGGCPDLSGSAGALLSGHETKKDIPMLNIEFFSCITLKCSVRVRC